MTEKYRTRSIVLADTTRAIVHAMITNAPNGIEIVAREAVKARGVDQNSYYWLILGQIADQAYFSGKKYTSDIWHEYCRREVMPETITTKDGTERSKWIEMPKGLPVVISTTQLDKKCFAEYTTAVEAFGASLGVVYSANPRQY